MIDYKTRGGGKSFRGGAVQKKKVKKLISCSERGENKKNRKIGNDVMQLTKTFEKNLIFFFACFYNTRD